ncbi:MAG: hypothetical protein ACJ8DF_16625, partial [Microvirga sp.]
ILKRNESSDFENSVLLHPRLSWPVLGRPSRSEKSGSASIDRDHRHEAGDDMEAGKEALQQSVGILNRGFFVRSGPFCDKACMKDVIHAGFF